MKELFLNYIGQQLLLALVLACAFFLVGLIFEKPVAAFIEQKSIKIAREIEKYLIGKYTGMDGDDE